MKWNRNEAPMFLVRQSLSKERTVVFLFANVKGFKLHSGLAFAILTSTSQLVLE